MSGREQPLVKVATAENEAVAGMWRELLDNNGIPCLVRITGPLLAYATFTSSHDLYVVAVDAERARDLLAAYTDAE